MQEHVGADSRRRALGKGLESLLPWRPASGSAAPMQAVGEQLAAGQPLEIAVDLIDRNPYQTRSGFDEDKLKELSASIAATGVVQPILVRPGKDGRFTLVVGERRLLASKRVGKSTIPAIVRTISDLQTMEMTVVENLQRADLNPMEQARAYGRLSRDFHLTQEQMAARTGKDRATVGNYLRLLGLPLEVQKMVEAGLLSFGHARTLLALPTELTCSAAQKVAALSLSVRATESLVRGLLKLKEQKQEKAAEPQDPNVREAQVRLRQSLGLKVTIEDRQGKGRVIIEYAGVEDFDSILNALGERA